MENIEQYIKENNVDIAILSVPKSHTHSVADILVDSGIKGLLNFSYTEVKTTEGVAVENVHLSDSLMTLSYRMKSMNK